jgi:hypothetical protein
MSLSDSIDLLEYSDRLRLRTIEGVQKVLDPIRKKWYVLQPEELVRQLVITFLHQNLYYPLTLIGVEKQLVINNMKKRFDLVVYDNNASPMILIECKSPRSKINEKNAMQIAQYNLALKAKYLWLSNGVSNFFYSMDYEEKKAIPIEMIPTFR